MKLVINKRTNLGRIVTEAIAEHIHDTHRVYDVTYSYTFDDVMVYTDPWGVDWYCEI